MTNRTLIVGGMVATGDGLVRADVLIEGETIAGLVHPGTEIADAVTVDATGQLVLPAAIDVHTHFEEPDPELLEGFTTGGWGAAAGGVATVVEMPQAHPTTTSAELLREKIAIVETTAVVDMALFAGAVGEPLQDTRELVRMADAGAVAFKSFMASSSPFFPAVDHAQLLTAMRTVAALGMPYALHAEDQSLLAAGLAGTQGAGRTDAMAHADSRPPVVETVAVASALALAEQTGCRLHVCHVASAAALQLIREAKARGVHVTAETCPQYLLLNTDDLVRLRGFARCAPAIRRQSEVDLIWEGVIDGTIDLVASDHSPYRIERKQSGDDDIFNAPLGLPGVETLVPACFDAMVHQRGISLSRFVELTATNPAKVFGLHPRKGAIRVGADADIMVFDASRCWTIRGADAHHRQKWTPYEGRPVTGRVTRTIRRGQTIFDGGAHDVGRITAEAGTGRFLPRGYGRP